ncbi:MAG TPA: hypothetical protein VH478_25840 [Trebonia sp.]|nr:hypothetical protein [Trebonia sp.]
MDPTIPRAAREALLAGAARDGRPGVLPADPDQRMAAVGGAATGLGTGFLVAVTGAAPWAIGVLIFQGAAGWQSATGRYALLLMEMIIVLTSVIFAGRVARHGPAGVAGLRARYRGRYVTEADLDPSGRALLRRAQEASDAVTGSRVGQAGLLDEVPALAAQEWDIAVSLRDQARLRAQRAEIAEAEGIPEPEPDPGPGPGPGPAPPAAPSPGARLLRGPGPGAPPPGGRATEPPAESPATRLLREQADAARAALRSVSERVAALEGYAGEVRAADAAYRDSRARARLAELNDPHLDLVARTAADVHGIAELTELTARAAAIREALQRGDQPG